MTKDFEYMAAGLLIIYSDFPVKHQLVEEAGTGIYANPSDLGDVRATISRIVEIPGHAQSMSQRGRNAANGSSRWQTQAEIVLALIKRLST